MRGVFGTMLKIDITHTLFLGHDKSQISNQSLRRSPLILNQLISTATSNTGSLLSSLSCSLFYDSVTDICQIAVKLDAVTNLLEDLDICKGAEPDNMSALLLVRCTPSIALPISLLSVKSLGTVQTLAIGC